MKPEKVCTQTVHLVREVGAFIRREQSKVVRENIETKSLNSLVSYVDQEAEKRLVQALGDIYPEAGFIAEEGSGKRNDNGPNWIIDPLDGTTNYLHGLPIYAISVALMINGKVVVGVVYELGQNECFYAWEGGGAWCNDTRISVSSHNSLADSLLATGFPYFDFQRMEGYLGLLGQCFQRTRGVRRFGSAATDLAYVACGRFDAYFEYGLSPWDVAAGVLLVREAGGVVSAFSPTNDPVFGGEILASSDGVYEETLTLVREHL